jgi:hypothetical protein
MRGGGNGGISLQQRGKPEKRIKIVSPVFDFKPFLFLVPRGYFTAISLV